MTSDAFLLVLAVLVPFIGVLAGLVLGARHAQRIALLTLPLGLAIAFAIARALWQADDALVYLLGGWRPPLGVALGMYVELRGRHAGIAQQT